MVEAYKVDKPVKAYKVAPKKKPLLRGRLRKPAGRFGGFLAKEAKIGAKIVRKELKKKPRKRRKRRKRSRTIQWI